MEWPLPSEGHFNTCAEHMYDQRNTKKGLFMRLIIVQVIYKNHNKGVLWNSTMRCFGVIFQSNLFTKCIPTPWKNQKQKQKLNQKQKQKQNLYCMDMKLHKIHIYMWGCFLKRSYLLNLSWGRGQVYNITFQCSHQELPPGEGGTQLFFR